MTLLLLAGTGDARALATRLDKRDVVSSLAGVTRAPMPLTTPTRRGGFGGEAGFRRYIADEGITAVLDATHPFATHITARSARICTEMNLPYLQYLRPEWQPEPRDNWLHIAREEDAAALIPQNATVFLGTGRQSLLRFANLAGREIICRQIDPPDAPFPFAGGRFEVGRPPFSVEDEIALFRALGVDFLVVKNAGGAASRTKLTAARILEIPVLMITRPPPGDWDVVNDLDAALDWAMAHSKPR